MEYNILIEEPAWNYLKTTGIIIVCLIVAILALILNAYWRKRKEKPLNTKEKVQIVSLIIVFIIGIIICMCQIYDDILYVYDYKYQNNFIVTERIESASRKTRDTCIIYTDTNEYIVPSYNYSLKEYGELCSYINNNFAGFECEIKYFKLSKFVKSIKIID